MKRYRVIYSKSPSGGYHEFSAADDEAAIAEVTRHPWKGRVVSLSERVGEWSARQIEIPDESVVERSVFDDRIVLQGDDWEIVIVDGEWFIQPGSSLTAIQAYLMSKAILTEQGLGFPA